jgi:hypothetical protein
MAQKISDSIFFMKRVFPIVWFGFLIIMVGVAAVSAIAQGGTPADLMFVVTPLIIAFVGYTVMKRLVFDLVDEVYDHGDYLVVRNRGDETRIELADIMNVSVSTMMNPPRITLRLRQPTRLGSDVSFSPAGSFRWLPFGDTKNAIAEDLIVRVDRARSKR